VLCGGGTIALLIFPKLRSPRTEREIRCGGFAFGGQRFVVGANLIVEDSDGPAIGNDVMDGYQSMCS